MAIRPFRRDDIPRVADLYEEVVRGGRGSAPPGLRAAFERIFFTCPWADPQVPSLVFEEDDGAIGGFLGSHVRRMVLGGKPVRLACSGQLLTRPEVRSKAIGAFLLKKHLDGPQDLSITDGANVAAQRLWEGLGGEACLLKCIEWTRVLRPLRLAGRVAAGRRGFGPLPKLLGPLLTLGDVLVSRLPPARVCSRLPAAPPEPLSFELIQEWLPTFAGAQSLRPDYDRPFVGWLFVEMAQMKLWGDLHASAFRTADGKLAGWYVCYLASGGIGQVMQIAATEETVDSILERLFHHARRQGAVAVQGRVEHRLLPGLSRQHCLLHYRPATLIHSRNPEILRSIQDGRAFLTRLEGEWWMSFHRERYA